MVRKSAVDTNSYRPVMLENGLEVLLISNPALTKASCAISVNVGSFDNPEAFPGLAHFLEHMLFMGTEAYPGENDFQNFLSLHNGYSNAYTAGEMTVYYCDVDAAALETMADMLSAFFISPLFARGSVDREISAVDSEYLNSLNNHGWRIYALLGELTRKDDPRGRFTCGNSETLRHDRIWEKVVQFWKDNYSSDLMKLVVCSNHNFGEMEGFLSYFSKIRRNDRITKKGKFCKKFSGDLDDGRSFCFFDRQYLQKIVQMAPLDDLKELSIFVNLPPALHLFRKNPYSFIEFLFTSPEPDGLLARLKNEGLAFTLSMDHDYFAESTQVKITVGLTNEGCEAHRRVLDLVVAYLRCMQVDERDFARLKRVQEEEFRVRQPNEPLDLVEELVASMQMFPVEHVLDHEYVYESFDQGLVRDLAAMIGDCSRWIVILSNNKGEFDRKEKYYGVEYRVVGEYGGDGSDAESGPAVGESAELSRRVQDASLGENIALLSRACGQAVRSSTFVFEDKWAADSYLDSMDLVEHGERFVKMEEFENGSVSYVFDQEFAVPKCKIFILLRSSETKSAYVPLELYLSLTEDAFSEEHARRLRNYHIGVEASVVPDGVLVRLEGVSSRIPEICRCFFDGLSSVRPERFALFRKQTEDVYTKKITGAPFRRLGEVFGAAKTGLPSSEDCLDVLRTIVSSDILFLSGYRTEVVAVGNTRYSDVLEIYRAAACAEAGGPAAQHGEDGASPETVERGFRTTDKFNNALGLFYETVDFSGYRQGSENVQILKAAAVGRLFHQIGFDDFFHQLRTTEELGYCVVSRMHTVKRHEYLAFMVQSQQSVEFLETRVRRFVQDLVENVRTMDTETFETHKESLVSSYEEPILNIDALGSFIWNQHLNTVVDLGFNEKMISAVKELSKADLLGSGVFESYNKVYSYTE